MKLLKLTILFYFLLPLASLAQSSGQDIANGLKSENNSKIELAFKLNILFKVRSV